MLKTEKSTEKNSEVINQDYPVSGLRPRVCLALVCAFPIIITPCCMVVNVVSLAGLVEETLWSGSEEITWLGQVIRRAEGPLLGVMGWVFTI